MGECLSTVDEGMSAPPPKGYDGPNSPTQRMGRPNG